MRKNRATDYAFCKLVRIIKHIQSDMVKEHIGISKNVSSEELLCFLSTFPNDVFTHFDSLNEKLRYLVLQCDNNAEGKLALFFQAMRSYVEFE